MQPFGRNRYGPKIRGGGCAPFRVGEAGSPSNNVVRAEAYLHAKFYLDQSNRLAIVHQRYRQSDRQDRTDRTTVR